MTKTFERVLVVAAHPDDEVLGCGGTIARVRGRGAAVRVVFLAEGITARFDPAQFDTPDVQSRMARRNANAKRALAILGVEESEIFTQTRPCCRLDQVPMIDLVKQIETHIRDWRPTCLLTHSAHDPNVDHRLAFDAVLAASRPSKDSALKAVLSFEVLSSTEWNPAHPFAPTYFVDITDTIERKIAAMAAYEDEMRQPPHPRSPEVIRAQARLRGAQAGADYAEGFALLRLVDS
ncbi:MAG: PIG-L deacetylase family protein [Alphaproteobacteria bacterium]